MLLGSNSITIIYLYHGNQLVLLESLSYLAIFFSTKNLLPKGPAYLTACILA